MTITVPDSKETRHNVPSFLVNGMPKSGTHLLARAVSLFPGIRQGNPFIVGDASPFRKLAILFPWFLRGGAHIGRATLPLFRDRPGTSVMEVLIGVDWPRPVPARTLWESLQRLGPGRYATAHLPYSEALTDILAELGMKSLIIMRDPRDIAVSHAKYVVDNPRHLLHEYYQSLPESDRILHSIKGIEQPPPPIPSLPSVLERYQSILPWISCALNHTTTFERLVGPRGGGSRGDQIQEIDGIARHLGISATRSQIERVADALFGGTTTFRKGLIGGWRDQFTEREKRAFKETAGQLLIELGYERDPAW